MSNLLKDYSYDFPEDLIALYPAEKRDASRLMVLNRGRRSVTHGAFPDLVGFLRPGDVLVVNDSKVFPCRLVTKRNTGGRQEILLLNPSPETALPRCETRFERAEAWRVMLNASGKVGAGDAFEFDGLRVTILSETSNERQALLEFDGELMERLAALADIPLPPYIRRKNEPLDRERYQTVYARDSGSVAAPTAGLHFTPEITERLRGKGVDIVPVTLHVGPGTFLPVRSEDVSKHEMHSESFSIGGSACDALNRVKKNGGRVIAVGTTAARTLETLATNGSQLKPRSGTTAIFIRPPYEFKIVDALVTNFHQPESTLLMLVSAFAGREFVLEAYREAVRNRYRLFSYGDCMLIT